MSSPRLKGDQMKLSPNYEAIRDRAIEILQIPGGGAGDCRPIEGALIQAKKEIEPETAACRPGRFNLGNFEKAAREVRKHFRLKAQA
jgi:hypothetical protein